MVRQIAILTIKAYQKFGRPLILPCCRFAPSCSDYALGALNKYGLFKGSWLALKRVAKCHPFSRGGYDPLN